VVSGGGFGWSVVAAVEAGALDTVTAYSGIVLLPVAGRKHPAWFIEPGAMSLASASTHDDCDAAHFYSHFEVFS